MNRHRVLNPFPKPHMTKWQHQDDRAPRGQQSRGLQALDRFARAKQSTYDPKQRKEKERALNAKTVNKYRKLQKRLQAQQVGRLAGCWVGAWLARPGCCGWNAWHGHASSECAHATCKHPCPPNGPVTVQAGHDGPTLASIGEVADVRAERGAPVGEAASPARPAAVDLRTGAGRADGKPAGPRPRDGRAPAGTAEPGHSKRLSNMQRLALKVGAEREALQREEQAARTEAATRAKDLEAKRKARKKESRVFRKTNTKGQPVMKDRIQRLLQKIES